MSYVEAAQTRLGEAVLAAGPFTLGSTHAGGRGDFVSATMALISLVMTRRETDLPRRLVVAVTEDRVYLLKLSRQGVSDEVASWARSHVQAWAEPARRGWEVWVQPPGTTPGFELRAPTGAGTDAVVAALTGAREAGPD